MKKLLLTFFTLVLALCAVGLGACDFIGGGGNNGCENGTHSHNYIETVLTVPTCTEKGKVRLTCSCGDSYETDLNALGHDFTEYISNGDATETADGTETATCNRVGCTATDTRVDLGSNLNHTHDYKITSTTNSTCTEQGYTTYTCSCGDSYNDDYTDKIPHNFGSDNKCTVCGQLNNADNQKPTEGLAYTLSEDKTYYICTDIGTATEKNIVIANTYNNLPVKSIGDGAFWRCGSLQSIVIPDSVQSIGYEAFYDCESLQSVTIPDSLESIGYKAFYNCRSLQYNVYDNAKYLGNASNPYLYLADAVNSDITSCEINSNTKIIVSGAFYNCESLQSITVNSNNKNYSSLDGNLYNKDKTILLQYATGKTATSFTISNNVQSIGDYAFDNCDSLQSITIPDSVQSIGDYAFGNCTSLQSIEIPDSVKSIGNGAFWNCYSLQSVVIPDSVKSIGDYAFYECNSLQSITIGNSVQSIGDGVFEHCRSLQSVVIPDSVKSIGNGAFWNCYSLQSVTIPDSVQSIGDDAFFDCRSLQYNVYDNAKYLGNASNPYLYLADAVNSDITSCEINSNTKIIVSGAFWDCDSLQSVTIPDSVQSIGDGAFDSCYSLQSITVDSNNKNYSSLDGNLYNKDKTILLQYATGKAAKSFIIPDSVKSIGNGVFEHCRSLQSIEIPDSVRSIGDYTFYNCKSLTSVTIGNSVQSIGDYAFSYCIKLTSIEIPNSVQSIGDYAFYECNSLQSITIGNSVQSIGNGVFEHCRSLQSITIGNGVKSIGDFTFSDCHSLQSITFTGTKEQWNNISKCSHWDYSTYDYIIYCTDGNIAKS